MRRLLVALFLLSLTTYAVDLGETVPNICATDADGAQHCLNDYEGVRVLMFNAGWCGPCQNHMHEMGSASHKYDGKPVTFLSMSINGMTKGALPDANFLRRWQQVMGISFPALASSPQQMREVYGNTNSIPADVIVDSESRLYWKAVGASVNTMFSKIDELL